jgi:hypothetical protein
MSDKPTCRTCPYCEIIPAEDGDDPDTWMGVCHRFPPGYVGRSDRDAKYCSHADPGEWSPPWVSGVIYDGQDRGDWCGEHPAMPAWIASQFQVDDAQVFGHVGVVQGGDVQPEPAAGQQ